MYTITFNPKISHYKHNCNNKTTAAWHYLVLSIASVGVSISAQAITPEQYQQQRTEALKQQQL
ncbi:hypothetical protein, partial [Psychrobacter urativorans]